VINLPPKTTGDNSLNRAITDTIGTRATTSAPVANGSSTNNIIDTSLLERLQQGQILTAQVKSTQVLSNSEKSLLKTANPSLFQTLDQQLQSTPSNKDNTNNLLNTPAGNIKTNTNTGGIQNTTLYFTKLLINQSNIKPELLTTITPEKLMANEQVLISQRNGQLVINKPLNQTLQQVAIDTIKQSLPKQQSVSQLQQFVSNLQQLPAAVQTKLFNLSVTDSNILQTVKAISLLVHAKESLSQPQQVKSALENSGVQLESKIAQQKPLHTDIRTHIDKLYTFVNKSGITSNQAHNLNNLQNSTGNPEQNISVNPPIGKILKEIDKLLINLASSPTSTTTIGVTTQASNNLNIPTSTAALFRLLGVQLPPENQTISLPQVIQQHLKKLLEQTQARIQLNQLRSLNLDSSSTDSKANTAQQFHSELPLRFNDQILPLQIIIKEQEQDSESERKDADESNPTKEKQRQWQVFLSFELPNNENLHTQLNIINDSVSATIWTESTSLCQKAKQDINVLRDKLIANGLTVDDLSCIHGKPPKQDFELGYNLIDIQT
jgi:hypothetical protein